MRPTLLFLRLALLVCFAVTLAGAQTPQSQTNPNDTLQTVQVNPDNRVTFRFYAPKASTVTVGGDFLSGAPAVNLTKDDEGVWSFTTNPLLPDSYTYNFSIDGIAVMDTKNVNFRENPNALFNFFDMPGPETDFMALKNVPHGRVEKVIYHSNSLNMNRRFHVYLPPHCESLKGKLPVLYLLHGGGDNDISWTSAGKVNLILDNLYAEGKLKNMIVVMPSGHVAGQPRGRMMFPTGPIDDPFSKDFLNDLVPFVKATYPISSKREDTAIAGFSMGGVQTLNLALWNPTMFDYVFPISTGYFPGSIKEIEEKDAAILKNVQEHPFKLFIMARGKDDTLTAQNCQATRALLERRGIHFQYQERDGGHSFVFSRRFLASMFPLLFR